MSDEEYRKLDLGGQLAEDFREWEAYCNGEPNECDVEEYTPSVRPLTGAYIQQIRKKVARSTRKFEAIFGLKARQMEALESGDRKPDAGTTFLLRCIELDHEAALRVVPLL